MWTHYPAGSIEGTWNRPECHFRLWQRFQDDGNVSRCYSTGLPPVTTPNEDRYLASYCKKKKQTGSIRPVSSLSSATGTTVERQTVYRRLKGTVVLYDRRPVRCVPLTRNSLSPAISLE
ncbi:hypothetical protein AVEN_129224-1 [Araneus ventricosus]|uniref:Uncharacterized protein n=1 Tax=Araneus ventricosus TaxID=182803 RepID=A0A4Y2BLV9_ARAVE|nr:hypothetical protein AVEN_129224-1 [Araneus ventricosus]